MQIENGLYNNYVKKQIVKLDKEQEDEKNLEEDRADDMQKSKLSDVDEDPALGKSETLERSKADNKEKKKTQEEILKETDVPMGKIWADLKGNRFVVYIGIICSLIEGLAHPILGYLLADIIDVLAKLKQGKDASDDLLRVMLVFVAFGVISQFTAFGYMYLFGIAGQTLTSRLRARMFKKIMKNDVQFFDDPMHSPGSLCANLEKDANELNNMITSVLSGVLMNISN